MQWARAALIAVAILRSATFVRAATATGLSSFEGREEPTVLYHPASKTFTNDSYTNITDVGNGTVRFTLRYYPDWWDGDRATTNDDRQRAEVKGLGPHQKANQTFVYSMDWRTNSLLRGTSRFTHIFQLKSTDGDSGAPLVTLSLKNGTSNGALQVWSGSASNSTAVRSFSWTPGVWQHAEIRITTSQTGTGSVMASINGDALAGLANAPVFRPDATDYRPKWGLYRGTSSSLHIGEDWVEHRNVSAVRIVPEPAIGSVAVALGIFFMRRRSRGFLPDLPLFRVKS